MSTIERNKNKPPIVPPPDLDFWDFYERDFTLPAEPYPTQHLIGWVMLEDCVASAEAKFEQGLTLDSADRDLLILSQDCAYDIPEEY